MFCKRHFVGAAIAVGLLSAVGVYGVVARRNVDERPTVLLPSRDRADHRVVQTPVLDEAHLKAGPYPPLVDFPVVPAADAGPVVRDNDFVVGVEINGEARAYPINMLAQPENHVLDDTLGNRPIAVTWCGVCQAAIVYLRRVEGRTLNLHVDGSMYLENMVMKDAETASTWPQLLGRAIDGPLQGRLLERIPSIWTDWKSWRTAHPATTVLELPLAVDHYHHELGLERSARDWDYLTTLVWGLDHGKKSVSWPLEELNRQPVVNDELAGLPILVLFWADTWTISAFDRRVDKTVLTFRRGESGLVDDQTGSTWDPVTGRAISGKYSGIRLSPVAGTVTRVGAWHVFHPDSELRMARPG